VKYICRKSKCVLNKQLEKGLDETDRARVLRSLLNETCRRSKPIIQDHSETFVTFAHESSGERFIYID